MTSAQPAASPDLGTPSLSAARIARLLGPFAIIISLLSALATFLVLAGLTPIVPTHTVVVRLLGINALTVLLLLAVIAREVWLVIQARRRGRAAARLHVRIVGLFSIIAAVPAILVAVVASVTLDRGLDQLFSARIHSAIQNSFVVAEAYLREHAQTARGEVLAMAVDVGRSKSLWDQDRERFNQFFRAQTQLRAISTAIIFTGDLSIIERVDLQAEPPKAVLPSTATLATVTEEEPQVAVFPEATYVAAVVKLRNFDNAYLYVARPLDPRVVAQLRDTRASILEYTALEERRLGVQIAFALMYTVIALSILLSAVLIGFNFANSLIAPIRRLIGAANVVSTGNLYVQVPVQRSEGDLANLGETFNKMTQELRTQRDDIVRARDVIDSRRRFTEAVLAGASAGVIGVDSEGRISILNRSAEKLIGRAEPETLGRPLIEIVPELTDIFAQSRNGMQRLVQGQITLNRNGRERNLSIRVTTEQSPSEPEHGYVITLDDITDLVAAQRTSAWADVARRIAHEIKNPLTPIQLSAERLRRKYGSVITNDREIFEQCTNTIVRQVDDIKRMVDEFSKFAQMPKPAMAPDDVADTIRQVVFLMRVGHADLKIDAQLGEDPMPARFDRRLISQALTNIIKNATEGIAALPPERRADGHIHVFASRDHDDIIIDIVDNGIGLPKDNRNRLLEPYVTTREKGTGLGLAIVTRIMEDHGGGIELGDAQDRIPGEPGAWMRLRFAADSAAEPEATSRKAETVKS